MKQCIPSHYMPLIPPQDIKLKALLIDVLDSLLMEDDDIPDGPFYIHFAPEITDDWCVGEKIGDCVIVRYKGKEVKIGYLVYMLVIEFGGSRYVIGDNDDIIIDCNLIVNVLLGEVTGDDLAGDSQYFTSPEEQQIIDEMLARSNGL